MIIRGNRLTLFLGLGLLTFGLLSAWNTGRFVSGAKRIEGRVFYAGGGSTFVVEYASTPRHTEHVLVQRPTLGLFRTGKPISILINPAVAHDPLHLEFYSIIPVTARVASWVYLWGWAAFLLVLAGLILTLYFLSVVWPRQFHVSTRFKGIDD